MQGTSATV